MIMAMSPAASWGLLLSLIAVVLVVVGTGWLRDVRRQRELDRRIRKRYTLR